MRILIPLFFLILSCNSIHRNLNFKNSTALAIRQDMLFYTYLKTYKQQDTIDKKEVKRLKSNSWVKIAAHIAPGNLVIRQWVLIDLYTRTPAYKDKILKMLRLLSYGEKTWAEGYSYWLYVKGTLFMWIEAFKGTTDVSEIEHLIKEVEGGFVKTAYKRGKVLYPAPFGDLRDQPLDSHLQQGGVEDSCNISVINVSNINSIRVYDIQARPIGLNHHIPKYSETVIVINGHPVNYKFYNGSSKKYSSKTAEYLDLFDKKRILSIPLF